MDKKEKYMTTNYMNDFDTSKVCEFNFSSDKQPIYSNYTQSYQQTTSHFEQMDQTTPMERYYRYHPYTRY